MDKHIDRNLCSMNRYVGSTFCSMDRYIRGTLPSMDRYVGRTLSSMDRYVAKILCSMDRYIGRTFCSMVRYIGKKKEFELTVFFDGQYFKLTKGYLSTMFILIDVANNFLLRSKIFMYLVKGYLHMTFRNTEIYIIESFELI